MDDWEWVAAAKNRQQVVLHDGTTVTLVSWGVHKGISRARVEYANGRQRTLSKRDVIGLADLQTATPVN
jgi:hypothetical protein